MDRDELAALRDAIDLLLAWPEAVRAEVARWLAPKASARSNGLDHDEASAPGQPAAAKPNGLIGRATAKARPSPSR